MAQTNTINVRIRGDATHFKRSLHDAQRQLDDLALITKYRRLSARHAALPRRAYVDRWRTQRAIDVVAAQIGHRAAERWGVAAG